jgi:polar amino acid transport system substrate-binding protein
VKRFLFVLLVVLVVLLAAACGSQQAVPTAVPEVPTTAPVVVPTVKLAAPTTAPAEPTAAPPPAATALPAAAPTAGASKVSGTLNVGLNSENVPWEFMKDGKLTGFEVDMLNELAKRMNVKLNFVTVPFSGIFTGLQASKWDLASSSIWITEARLKEMDFADPYYDSDLALLTPKDSKIKSFADMKGGTFGADTGAVPDKWLKDNQGKYGPYTIKEYDNPTDAFLDCQAGRLDGVAADAPTALFYAKQNPDAGLIVPLLMNQAAPQAWAFRKGDPLRDAVNSVQNDMKKDGTLATIYKTWFGQDPPANSSTVKVYDGGYKLPAQ